MATTGIPIPIVATARDTTPGKPARGIVKNAGLVAAVVALVAVLLAPVPTGLPPAGHAMLAILAFALVIWMTEALDYSVSAVVIAALMTYLLAYQPELANAKAAHMGTGKALGIVLSGFSNSAVALVAAA